MRPDYYLLEKNYITGSVDNKYGLPRTQLQ
jgi:hypothetical protein